MATELKPEMVKGLEPPESGSRFVFDDHRDAPRGFGVRVYDSGYKAFVWRYTNDAGKRRVKVIGKAGTSTGLTLTAARKEANRLAGLLGQGKDPVDAKKARKASARNTVESVGKEYLQRRVDILKSGRADRRYFERDIFPEIGDQPIGKVTRSEIKRIVEAKAKKTPRAAHHLLRNLKGLFEYAADEEIIAANPAAGLKPRKINPAMKPRSRERVLDDDEIQAFWSKAETCGIHKLTALALKLALVTGQRPGEIAGMRWSEIDGNAWTIPAARRLKTETDHRVPLTSLAQRIIEDAKTEAERLSARRDWDPGDRVFPVRRGTLDVASMGRAVNRYAKPLKNKGSKTGGHWRPHDLRRTCRTGLSAAGVSAEIAERVIGHTLKGIQATYNLHQYDDEKHVALEKWERRLLEIVGEPQPERKVLPMREVTA